MRKYDRDGFGGSRGTIQSDFLEAVGLEYTPDLLEGNPDKNVTFHGQVLEAKRFYNMMEHPDLTRHEIVAAFHGAENRLKKNGRLLEGVYFTRQERREFMSRYAKGNRAVAEEYLGTVILFDLMDLVGEDEQSSFTTEQITEVKMTIMDCGIPYDPLKRPDPDVSLEAEARQIGGLGIYMVKQMMEEVSYEYRGGMNILRMRKMF